MDWGVHVKGVWLHGSKRMTNLVKITLRFLKWLMTNREMKRARG